MTVTDDHQTLQADWQRWHDEREETLREPHGWLALTALEWLDQEPRAVADLPGTWRAPGDGSVEIAASAVDGVEVDGERVDGTRVVHPVDGAPGVLVTVGERVVELARRTDSYALRVRDPQAATRTAFRGVPHFPVDARWVVRGRFEPYAAPQRITVGAVVDGLAHFPTAVGTVAFDLDGREHLRRRPHPAHGRPGRGRLARRRPQPHRQPALRLHRVRDVPAPARRQRPGCRRRGGREAPPRGLRRPLGPTPDER